MKTLLILINLLTIQSNFVSDDNPKKLKSPFETKSEKSKFDNYVQGSSNNYIINSELGESKYDKEVNLDADIDEKDVKGSIKKFREKKGKEENQNNLSITLFLLLFAGLAFAFYSFFLREEKK